MEQDVKVGAAGDVKIDENLVGESLKGSIPLGPMVVSLDVEVDNAKLLAYLAAKVPGGMLHQGIVLLQQDLFPTPSA